MANENRTNFKEESAMMLLVEGINDCHVVAALCVLHQLPPKSFTIFDSGCEDKAIKKLSARLDAADGSIPLDKIAIVLDADDDLNAKWQSLCYVLIKRGYTVPSQPHVNGTIISAEDKPTVGIWLMPNNQTNGMLEDFCQTLIDNQDALDYVNQCITQAKQQNYTSFKDVHLSKAVIHTYLAWQDEPAKPLGQAITAKVLNGHHPLAVMFKDWLEALFIVPASR